MSPSQRKGSLASRYPLAAPILWLSSVQYFLVQAVAAAAWSRPSYNWRLNAISDLGATHCGQFDGRYVCSPAHEAMNVSFIVLGLGMALGSVLFLQEFGHSRTGFLSMAVAGLGAMLVGFFPEDSVFWAHITGADLAFLVGNLALIAFGFSRGFPQWLRWYAAGSGVVALAALYLFLSHHRFFLGLGGMERVVAYPQTIWLIVFGAYMFNPGNRSAAKRPGRPNVQMR
jgi:hypothetical membrane protein